MSLLALFNLKGIYGHEPLCPPLLYKKSVAMTLSAHLLGRESLAISLPGPHPLN